MSHQPLRVVWSTVELVLSMLAFKLDNYSLSNVSEHFALLLHQCFSLLFFAITGSATVKQKQNIYGQKLVFVVCTAGIQDMCKSLRMLVKFEKKYMLVNR